MINIKNVITGIIPADTGNDFIQILGFPERLKKEHWDSFFEFKTKEIDIGICNGKTFSNGMGLGFDAKVASENYISPTKVKKGSKEKYYWHIIKNILFFKEQKMFIKPISDKEIECFLTTISIGRRFAGGFFPYSRSYC